MLLDAGVRNSLIRAYLHYRVADQHYASVRSHRRWGLPRPGPDRPPPPQVLYGRAMLLSVCVVNGYFMHVLKMNPGLVRVSAEMATTITVFWVLWLLVVRFQHIPSYYYRCYLMACALLYAVFPSWSVLETHQARHPALALTLNLTHPHLRTPSPPAPPPQG